MRDAQLEVGTFTRSLLIQLARDFGRFHAVGIEVRESSVPSSPAQFRSLEAGSFDLALTSPDNVLAYRFLSNNPLGRNLPVEIVSSVDRGLGLSLCLTPSIPSIDAVRGKVVGVDVPQSGFAFVAYALLAQAGLQSGDYTVESLGSTPRRASVLIEGGCCATVLNAGNELHARGAGCAIVSSVADIGPYVGTVVAAMATTDPSASDIRTRFADVILETAQEILAGDRQSEVIDAAMSLLGLTEAEAEAHYACLLAPASGLVSDGVLDRASISTLLELRRAYLPTPELESIPDSLSTMVRSKALEARWRVDP
jgi:ABC-type nitrate/sulfonate/bicarbonate transport system substrate-binding protein